MKTEDLIENIKYSSLKTLYVGTSTEEEQEKQIISFINRALRKIYTDCNIAQNAIRIYKEDDKDRHDLPELFIAPLVAYKDNGLEIPINREDREDSIYFPNIIECVIPTIYNKSFVDIIYKEAPEKIVSKEDNIKLGYQFEEPIIMYVSYIANELIHGAPNYAHQSFLTKYNQLIKDMKMSGVINNDGIVNQKLYQKGLV